MLELALYDNIIWDWNGTLVDDAWLAVETINGLLARRDMPAISAEEYCAQFDFPVIEYYNRLGFDFEREPWQVVAHEFIRDYEARRFECPLQNGARATLEQIASQGRRQCVLSATHQESLGAYVGHYGLTRYFIDLVGLSDHFARSKVERGRLWLSAQDWDPARTLLIGDTRHDGEVARELGVDCVLFTSGHQPMGKLAALGVPVVRSLCDIFSATASSVSSS